MKDGGSAFPCWHGDVWQDGITLRQWYKGMALMGMLANRDYTGNSCGEVAKMTGDYADAMLREDEEAGK